MSGGTDIQGQHVVSSVERYSVGADVSCVWALDADGSSQFALHLGLALWAFHAIYPLVWIFFTSLKYTSELYQDPFGLPQSWKWSNYREAWVNAQMGTYFLNSVIVTFVSTILVLFLSSTSAYALARFDFRGKGLVWVYILLGFLIPHSILLIPLAIFTRELGIYNSLIGLSLVYAAVGIPWNIFFLRAFMETIPKELEEAAILDGAGMVQVFKDVIIPLSAPALATMATFHILSCLERIHSRPGADWHDRVANVACGHQPARRPFHFERTRDSGRNDDHHHPRGSRVHFLAKICDQRIDRWRDQVKTNMVRGDAEMKAPSSREVIELNGEWNLAFDPEERTSRPEWIAGNWSGEFSQKVVVPGVWNLVQSDAPCVGYYYRTVDIPASWDMRAIHLHGDGATYRLELWVNGVFLGSHEGAYSPFCFDISSALRFGDANELVIRVASLSLQRPVDGMVLKEMPVAKHSWHYAEGGIWGSVWLESVSPVFVKSIAIEPNLHRKFAAFDITLANTSSEATQHTLQITVINPRGEKIHDTRELVSPPPGSNMFHFTVPIAHPLQWSCDVPDLYEVQAELIR